MNLDSEDFNLDEIRQFLKDQEIQLQREKATLQKKYESKFQRSTAGNHEKESHCGSSDTRGNTSPQSEDSQTSNKIMLNDKVANFGITNSREIEKEKLINSLSIPKTRRSCPNIREVNKLDSSRRSLNNSVVYSREKEKDRLAEIFASSGYRFSKTSNIQVYKNLNSELGFDKIQSFDLEKNNKCKADFAKPEYSQGHDHCHAVSFTEGTVNSCGSDTDKYQIPPILVSKYKEDSNTFDNKAVTSTTGTSMVRIGEFSPLNPNNPAGKPQLGLGEYEERRKLLSDQRKHEYNQYLQQVQQISKCQTPTREINHNNRCKDAATQTGWEDATVNHDNQKSPGHCSHTSPQQEETHCRLFPSSVSPAASCFEDLSEKEIKEHLYREELRKQIEEKNRLREEIKRKEEEEEAKLEAKIKRDQEEMKKQYEAERLQRLELAIRKKEQEDILRERLAAEQQKALLESKAKKKQLQKDKLSPRESSSQKCVRNSCSEQRVVPLSQSLPSTVASKALSEVHEVHEQPLSDVQRSEQTSRQSLHETEVPSRKVSALSRNKTPMPSGTLSPPIHKVREVDKLVQRAVFYPETEEGISHVDSRYRSPRARDYREEVDRLMKEPLLTESFKVLPPVSPPLLHATIPPVNPSHSPHIPASRRVQRTNSDVLEDKWKVPYVEESNGAHSDALTKHNRSVLTQLGAFRRHLQQERLRMQQRVVAESP